MGIKNVQVEINGISHVVQVNDDDKNAPKISGKEIEEPKSKSRTPANKAAKPAADK
ncbi:hypothetical protein [Microbacterium aurantiacum]|uniref:hypothetical protein n=1 Tax=Microbacterium aurantiacum TaxID=162393 RepID=UPI00341D4FAD